MVSRKKAAFRPIITAMGIPKKTKLAKPLYIQQFLMRREALGFRIVELVFILATQSSERDEPNRSFGLYILLLIRASSQPFRNRA